MTCLNALAAQSALTVRDRQQHFVFITTMTPGPGEIWLGRLKLSFRAVWDFAKVTGLGARSAESGSSFYLFDTCLTSAICFKQSQLAAARYTLTDLQSLVDCQ
jgi:hypothetical protein